MLLFYKSSDKFSVLHFCTCGILAMRVLSLLTMSIGFKKVFVYVCFIYEMIGVLLFIGDVIYYCSNLKGILVEFLNLFSN